jgi:hypothetical protein
MTTTEQPPAEGFETKSSVLPGIAQPGTPGYQLAGQPTPEHGEDGLQHGYSNSAGMEGDDGKNVFDHQAEQEEKAAKPARRTAAKSDAK